MHGTHISPIFNPRQYQQCPVERHIAGWKIFDILRQLRHLIVENIRTARRFLKKCDPSFDIGAVTFYELNRHTDLSEVSSYLEPLRRGEAVGVMSEAGCPAVADPGALPVSIAQREGLKVVPLVGPSSILMALMASGFNGQGFSFNGYLPIEAKEREKNCEISRRVATLRHDADFYRDTISQQQDGGMSCPHIERGHSPVCGMRHNRS